VSCKAVKLRDGTTALVNMTRRGKLTERDLRTLEKYAEFCRKRAAARQRERNADMLPGALDNGRLS
jgi:hypothetical protein